MNAVADRNFIGRLEGFVRNRVSNAEDARDLTQDILLRIHSRPDELRRAANARAWIHAVARNAIRDYYRARGREPRMDFRVEDLPANGVGENQALMELAACLRPMVEALPEKYGSALHMADLEGMQRTEIARELEISVPGAKSRVQRGREMLASRVLECCRVEFDALGRPIDFAPRIRREPCANDC